MSEEGFWAQHPILSMGAIALIGFGVIALLGEPSNKTERYVNGFAACVRCQGFVTKVLKAPSTAEWQSCSEADAAEVSREKFRIITYVDAQNSFGAMLRKSVDCTVYADGDLWRLESLSVDGEKLK